MRRPVFLFVIILYSMLSCLAQSSIQSGNNLQNHPASIKKEIEDVKNSLDVPRKNHKQTLVQLALLQKKLRLRQAAIENINSQLNFIHADMNTSWQEII